MGFLIFIVLVFFVCGSVNVFMAFADGLQWGTPAFANYVGSHTISGTLLTVGIFILLSWLGLFDGPRDED